MLSVVPGAPKRFGLAIAISAFANLLLWYSLSQLSSRIIPFRTPPVLQFSLVTMDEKGVKHEKIVKPKEVKKRIEQVKPKKPPEPIRDQLKTKAPPPPPQGAHSHVMTAKTPNPAPGDHPFIAPEGGNATPGVPIVQTPGTGRADAPTPPTPPVKQDTPTAPTPIKQTDTPPVKAPEPPTDVKPAEPAKPKGPTQDAQPLRTEEIQIPDNLKDQTFKSHVHVKVNVSADGSFEVTLRTSSGNPDVDKLALECLKKWKWKPALKDGEPVDSSHLFNFEFEVK